MSEVKTVHIPGWPELKTENLVALIRNDAEIAKYLKDEFWVGRGHSRPFLTTIINTMYPGLIQALIDDLSVDRHGVSGEDKEREGI